MSRRTPRLLADMRLTPAVVGAYAAGSVVAAIASVDLPVTERVLVAAAATVVAVVVAVALRPQARGLWRLLAVAVVVGVVRGLVLVLAADAVGARASAALAPDLLRVVVSTVNTTIWLVALALIALGRETYRTRYLAAVAEATDAATAAMLSTHPDLVRMQSTLGVVALTDVADRPALRAAADAIRREVADGLRPLSHRIWFSASDALPHPRWGRLVHDAVRTLPVPVVPVVGVWFVASVVGAPGMFGLVPGLVGTVIDTVVLAAMLGAWSRMRRQPRPAWLGPFVLVACAVVPIAATQVVRVGSPVVDAAYVLRLAFAVLALGALVLVASTVALAHADQERLLRLVSARGAGPADRVLSSYLHNSVQAELTGLALRLQQAEPGSAQAREAVERLGALASRSIADDFRAFREAPVERIGRLVSAWEGIATLSVVIDDAVDPADPRLAVVVQVVEEATSNAVRHGGATAVDVVVGVDPAGLVESGLVVDVRTDGVVGESAGPGIAPGTTTGGMGTGWLRAVSREPVVVEAVDGGTRMRLLV